jgi:hypothetical protein
MLREAATHLELVPPANTATLGNLITLDGMIVQFGG